MNLRGSMDFRVELSERAQCDIAGIYDWLRSQQAGEAGERWFMARRAAIASLTELPSRCQLAPENRDVPVENASCYTAGDRMSIGSCLLSKAIRSTCSTFATAAADPQG